MRRENPTIRQLYGEVAGMGGFCLIGTPADIVDVMQDWFEGEACDGFNITPTHLPAGCEDFVELITPELQRRGLLRTRVRGPDLAREPRPEARRQPVRHQHLGGAVAKWTTRSADKVACHSTLMFFALMIAP